jgi:hypothetical protein
MRQGSAEPTATVSTPCESRRSAPARRPIEAEILGLGASGNLLSSLPAKDGDSVQMASRRNDKDVRRVGNHIEASAPIPLLTLRSRIKVKRRKRLLEYSVARRRQTERWCRDTSERRRHQGLRRRSADSPSALHLYVDVMIC